MRRKHVPAEQLYIHFVTFSCYKRRQVLRFDQANRVVLSCLNRSLQFFRGDCLGFVLMPDHVHLLVWFPEKNQLADFLHDWKQQSSHFIKRQVNKHKWSFFKQVPPDDPIWQKRYYSFEIYDPDKVEEKLAYMHQNPVRAGLSDFPCDWKWSSARWYENGRSVGVPIRMPDF
ncbi:REP-associated tyrosine transposase [Bremerella sp. T1]|uniref:REP-associated tyrosine transposase n=1 Tax=Bremerella sp. TYQ1 TaxID=3119568 RepID=UPI001CC9176E|nr:transposase [Bremerella volcania]UBM38758.1 transposase [Bremerella volcania]